MGTREASPIERARAAADAVARGWFPSVDFAARVLKVDRELIVLCMLERADRQRRSAA